MNVHFSYLIYSLLGLVIIILLILFLIIFRKIRSTSADKFNVIQFPIETNNKIKDFINEVSDYLNKLGKLVSTDQKQAVKEINERLKIFETFANEKNQELLLYKEGYEYSKQKNIINGILDCVELIEKSIEKSKDNNITNENYLSAIKEKLEIILNNNGVEKFTPNINEKIFDTIGCEPSQITEKTTDENKINIIHSVLKPGYKIKLKDNLYKIVKKSLVKVYGLK
jgi:molecular chaperone GrpE (heat shock protein)